MRTRLAVTLLLAGLAADARPDDPDARPRGVPVVPITRDDLKRALEQSKHALPRLPLPPVTDEERAQAAKTEWGLVNNGRMRRHYLPAAVVMGGFTRDPDPVMSLGYEFQTRLFWIVSRINNCTYCMGHQEFKLAKAGLSEDQVAALDGDWSDQDPAARAAYEFTRRLTVEPYAVASKDIEKLRAGFTDAQILEILLVVGNFNAMNRWTGSLRIPQEEHRDYLTPTAGPYAGFVSSRMAPIDRSSLASKVPTCAAPARRPALESSTAVQQAIEACRTRAPRLPLVPAESARQADPLGSSGTDRPVPSWVRLLATFPVAGPQRIAMHRAAETEGELDKALRWEIAHVAARQDRAWYALAHARQALERLGRSDTDLIALDDPERLADPARRVALSLARKLTVDPALISDDDIESVRKHFSDRQTAEIVFQITEAAFFDRLTEAAGLPLEEQPSR